MNTTFHHIKNIFISLLISGIILFIIELVVSYTYKPSSPSVVAILANLKESVSFSIEKPRKIRLKEYPPDLDLKLAVPSNLALNKKFTELKTDKNGFISDSLRIKEDDNLSDIIFLGGSTSECLFVDESNRFPLLVDVKLDSIIGKNIKVTNAGVSANTSLHSTFTLLSKGLVLKPKVAFILHNINDLSSLNRTKSYWEGPISRSVIIENENYSQQIKELPYLILRYLKNKFFRNAYYLLLDFFKKDSNSLESFSNNDEWGGYRDKFYLNEIEDRNEIEDNFKKSLLTLIEILKKHEIVPIIMTQFNRIENNDLIYKETARTFNFNDKETDLYRKEYIEFNKIIKELAINENIAIIDLNSLVPKNEKYMYDLVHLNDRGSILVSEIIIDFLINNYNNLLAGN